MNNKFIFFCLLFNVFCIYVYGDEYYWILVNGRMEWSMDSLIDALRGIIDCLICFFMLSCRRNKI